MKQIYLLSILGLLTLSSCAIGKTLDAVNNIHLSDCINNCGDEVENCLDDLGKDSPCFDDLENCFNHSKDCSDGCLDCEALGTCEDEDVCTKGCTTLATSCSNKIDDCVTQVTDTVGPMVINQCVKPLVSCVAVCIEVVEKSLK